jgi:hypothetical protein
MPKSPILSGSASAVGGLNTLKIEDLFLPCPGHLRLDGRIN